MPAYPTPSIFLKFNQSASYSLSFFFHEKLATLYLDKKYITQSISVVQAAARAAI
jgi:hypothetical protein